MNNANLLNYIQQLSENTKRIRNISIIAHVDHGKTTLADQLISSNNIISKKMAGNVRYMDGRADEQLRGITMKSSSISLIHDNHLINLIDSPGHVEFSCEVSTALRLTDGALVLVDALEGFSSQTYSVLKTMFEEGIKGILILNKVDRLIWEKQLEPDEAYHQLLRIIDQVNATLSSFLNEQHIQQEAENQEFSLDDDNLIDIENKLYFSPEKNNVVFSSALDSWGFTIDTFAQIFSQKLKCNPKALQKCLWGNFYIKNKRIYDKPMKEGQSIVFVEFILKNLWNIYQNKDNIPKLQAIAKSLNIEGPIRDIKSLMLKWLPLDKVILQQVIIQLPNPIQAQQTKLPILAKRLSKNLNLHEDLRKLYESIEKCDPHGPLVVFIAKMIQVPPECIDEKGMSPRQDTTNSYGFARVFSGTLTRDKKVYLIGPKSKIISTQEQLDQTDIVEIKIDRIYQMQAQYLEAVPKVFAGNLVAIGGLDDKVFKTATISDSPLCPSFTHSQFKFQSILKTMINPLNIEDLPKLLQGIKRLYKSDPSLDVQTLQSGEIVIGTCGQVHLQRCITDIEKLTGAKVVISDPIIPFKETIIYKDLVEESNEKYQKKRAKVLQLDKKHQIKQYEVDKNKKDDVDKEKKMKFKKETQQAEDSEVIKDTNLLEEEDLRYHQLKNEEIQWKYNQKPQQEKIDHKNRSKQSTKSILNQLQNKSNLVEEFTPNRKISVKVRAIGLPFELAKWMEANQKIMRRLFYEDKEKDKDTQQFIEQFHIIRKELRLDKKLTEMIENNLYCFGPKKSGPNMIIFKQMKKEDSLIYKLKHPKQHIQQFEQQQQFDQQQVQEDFQQVQVDEKVDSTKGSIGKNDSNMQLSDHSQAIAKGLEIYLNQQELNLESMMKSMALGFDIALGAGPLCAEPIIGACYIVECIKYDEEDNQQFIQDTYGPISGQLISMMKDACLNSFLGAQPRLVESIYKCTLQTNYDYYGKVFDVLAQRRAKILTDELNQSTSLFNVAAHLPLTCSFDFYTAIQDATSGHVTAQLDYDGWVVLDVDPFYQPYTDDDLEEGEQVIKNIAKDLIMATRKRKGMNYEEKVVVAADKQRNLSKKK